MLFNAIRDDLEIVEGKKSLKYKTWKKKAHLTLEIRFNISETKMEHDQH